MRNDFVNELVRIADKDDRVVLLTADLGFHVVEAFAELHPDRFINVGVAEQNMIGMATGLAREGFIPFVYSIAPFAAIRGLEFIKNGPVAHNLPVRIVAVGAGVAYAQLGISHFLLEDIGALSCYDNLRIEVPGDRRQAVSILRGTFASPFPVYYRLGKNDINEIDWITDEQTSSGVSIHNPNAETLLIASGGAAKVAERAREVLQSSGSSVGLCIVSRMSPFPTQRVAEAIERSQLVVSVEDHGPNGGLADRVRGVLVGTNSRPMFRPFSVAMSGATRAIGSESEIFRISGIDIDSIVATVRAAL